jgi:hypothetical protein
MTPYDEWDFDGINEMILADINVKGKMTKALVHFESQTALGIPWTGPMARCWWRKSMTRP